MSKCFIVSSVHGDNFDAKLIKWIKVGELICQTPWSLPCDKIAKLTHCNLSMSWADADVLLHCEKLLGGWVELARLPEAVMKLYTRTGALKCARRIMMCCNVHKCKLQLIISMFLWILMHSATHHAAFWLFIDMSWYDAVLCLLAFRSLLRGMEVGH